VCGNNSKWCKNCTKSVDLNHKCFIKCESVNNSVKIPNSFIIFDFETYIDDTTNKRVVNLAMAQQICSKCVDILDDTKRCSKCQKKHLHYDINTFTNWILKQKNSILIAHDFKAFDWHFFDETIFTIGTTY